MVTTRRYILLILFKTFDMALLVASFIAAAVPGLKKVGATSLEDFLSMRISVRNFVLFSCLLLLWYCLFSCFGLYESKRLSGQQDEAIDVLKATSLGTLVLLVIGILFHISVVNPLFLALFWLLSTVTAFLSRRALRSILAWSRQRGLNLRHVLIVGTNPRAVTFAKTLETHSELGYRVLGFVDNEWPGMEEFRKSGYARICDLDSFPLLLTEKVVDEVVISLPISSFYAETSRIVAICEEQGVIAHVFSRSFDRKHIRFNTKDVDHDSLVTLHPAAMQGWALMAKRSLDIVISLSCLILFSPILIITAFLIKLSSPGAVFFVQKRVGLNKRLISVYKFRTMVADAESKQAALEHLNEAGGPVFKIKNDPRITSVGRILRKTSVDELPQLFNVLKGDMSLVGPRPLPVRDYQGFDTNWQRRRFSIRPGITCLWQINGRSGIQFEQWMELDLEYIDRWSVWLDLQILIRTIPAVLKGSGAA